MVLKNNAIWQFLAGMGILVSCSTGKQLQQTGQVNHPLPPKKEVVHVTASTGAGTAGLLDSLLHVYPKYFSAIIKHSRALNVQVIYTQVNRKADGTADMQHHYFNAKEGNYFYPASMVKLPIVLLALQKLNELKDKNIDRNTAMLTETAYSGQTAVFNEPTTPDGKPSIAQYIKKILLVSDNDAYNRLYEFLGQEYINSQMHTKGFTDVQVLHRLDIFLTEAENRNTNPVIFYDSSNQVLYRQPAQQNKTGYAVRNDFLGRGYYSNGKLVNTPMNFSKKNRISLDDLHRILIGLVFPDKVPAKERFNITEEDRQFVLKYMSMYPTESWNPPYAADTLNYWPAYCKFFLFGKEKGKLPANIRIFNKVGEAYGHLIDAAYVVDYKNKVEFFLSAVIYCNSDGILNDDQYDYDSTGLPFMKNLGRVLYDYELNREYKIRPNLSPLLFTYY